MKSYELLTFFLVIFSSSHINVLSSKVLELSDRFLEVKNEGSWLVKFYAPWCGHCKHLEPVWDQVAQVLVDTNIRVGRVDCTRFSSVATEFGVRGFPTILFIKGAKNVEFRGDRTRDDIAEFARRMNGPVVRILSDCSELESLKKAKPSFFVFFEDGTNGFTKMKDEFQEAAQTWQEHHYFYTAPIRCLPPVEGVQVPPMPPVTVFKDKTAFFFDNSTEKLGDKANLTLKDWINEERFQTFLKITNGNFYQLMKTGKNMVMAVLEENQIHQLNLKMKEFQDVLEAIALNNRELYHRHFTFGWLPNPDLANSVAMSNLPVPSLIIVNPETYQYYLPELPPDQITPAPQDVILLLNKVIDKSATAHGGDTLPYRIYRTYYEASTALAGMWKGNPVLTCVLFGLPLGFLSIICYTSCCHDILEASEEDESAEDDQGRRHEKKD